MYKSTIAPWHMWGNSQVLTIRNGASPIQDSNNQLVKVAYNRPETWRFLFWAKLLSINLAVPPFDLFVRWDVTTGIGRSVVQLPTFERYRFVQLLPPYDPFEFKFSTNVNGPLRDDQAGVPVVQNTIDEIVAQDIQVQVRTQTVLPSPGDAVSLEVGAFFAPSTHVRPDWFMRDGFHGELGGH